jgi:hypothetical protein
MLGRESELGPVGVCESLLFGVFLVFRFFGFCWYALVRVGGGSGSRLVRTLDLCFGR